MSDSEQYGYTVQEAAHILRKSHATIYRWIEAGKLRAVPESYPGGQRLKVYIDQPIEGEIIDDSHESAVSNAVSDSVESDKLNLAAALSIIEQQRVALDEKQSTIEELLRERAEMAGQLGGFAALETVKQIEGPRRAWWQRLLGR